MASIEIIPGKIQLVRMSDAEYFSEKYSDYISNSKLGLLNSEEGGSIEKYLEGFSGGYSPAFELGTAIHNMTLQKDDYTVSDLTKPNGKLGLFAEMVLKHRRNKVPIEKAMQLASKDANYYASSFSKTRMKTAITKSLPFYLQRYKLKDDDSILYLSTGIKDKFDHCMKGLEKKNIQKVLCPEQFLMPIDILNEYAILGELKVTLDNGDEVIIKVKGKLDNVTIDHESLIVTLNDLKSTGKPIGFFMGNDVRLLDEEGKGYRKWIDGSFQKFHYYRQIAMYFWLLQLALDNDEHYNDEYTYEANIVVVETIPNFNSKIYAVKNQDIRKGLTEMKTLIVRLAKWMNKK